MLPEEVKAHRTEFEILQAIAPALGFTQCEKIKYSGYIFYAWIRPYSRSTGYHEFCEVSVDVDDLNVCMTRPMAHYDYSHIIDLKDPDSIKAACDLLNSRPYQMMERTDSIDQFIIAARIAE